MYSVLWNLTTDSSIIWMVPHTIWGNLYTFNLEKESDCFSLSLILSIIKKYVIACWIQNVQMFAYSVKTGQI